MLYCGEGDRTSYSESCILYTFFKKIKFLRVVSGPIDKLFTKGSGVELT